MAQATTGTSLKIKKTGDTAYTILPGLKDFTDFGAKAERVETTTLSSSTKTYISGLQDTPELDFTFNYDPSDPASAYNVLMPLITEKSLDFELVFPDGSYYSWSGQASMFVKAGKVNAVLEFSLSVTATTSLTLNAAPAN